MGEVVLQINDDISFEKECEAFQQPQKCAGAPFYNLLFIYSLKSNVFIFNDFA
ncbi:hypothetical protein FACS1894137_02830 [Spirochaetia bacterium]|nr:hypothetical protein FACS1894137_02830 [Spirochaetia bacterium]